MTKRPQKSETSLFPSFHPYLVSVKNDGKRRLLLCIALCYELPSFAWLCFNSAGRWLQFLERNAHANKPTNHAFIFTCDFSIRAVTRVFMSTNIIYSPSIDKWGTKEGENIFLSLSGIKRFQPPRGAHTYSYIHERRPSFTFPTHDSVIRIIIMYTGFCPREIIPPFVPPILF